MSEEEFYGRPISKGFSSIEINLCEVCQRRSPNWLETKFDTDIPVVRFTCDDCHEEVINNAGGLSDEFFARELGDEEELPEPSRPAWVEEIIKEQQEAGSIETIGVTETVDAQTEGFSSAPDSFSRNQDSDVLEEEVLSRQVASWAPKFIQEALFGPNPETWLEKQQAFDPTNVDLTIKTLASFVDHDMPSVKLSAIQCLSSLSRRNPNSQSKVVEIIKIYADDPDETVSEFAQETVTSL